MSTRQTTLKTVLWAIMGVLGVLTLVRFVRGLGATTALTDASPWGFWIAFDVMSGVALAAGGFVLAATVYIFGRGKYRPFARPAILTAFLGYAAVAVGLMYDLGLPWHIYHPFIYPQHHSVLFEVAVCVILYLTVLSLEFSPVILEHRWFDRPFFRKILKFLKKVTIPLVITGIVLSTLHQSSLGSLFLITPYRLHPLWYSPFIWILFLVSAIGLGLMMVTAESFFSAWLFKHKLRMEQLSGLAKAASLVLILYLGLRLGDLAVRGVLQESLDTSWQSMLFLFEIAFSALVPAVLMLVPRVRKSPAGLAVCSGLVVFGMIGYRFDVCIVAFARPDGMPYFPSWAEIAVSVGVVAGAMLVFIFFVEHLKVYSDEHQPAPEKRPHFDPDGMKLLLPGSLSAPRRFSLAAVGGAALALAFLPYDSLFGDQFKETPVSAPRTIDGFMQPDQSGVGFQLSLAAKPEAAPIRLMVLDGNRDGRLVLFSHDTHSDKHGGEASCGQCHHQNMPFDKNSSCHECHRDMYTRTDTFDHGSHVDKLGGNAACGSCHQDPEKVKNRMTAKACMDCHTDMVVPGPNNQASAGGTSGYAPGYMDAMHGLCVSCHQLKAEQEPHSVNKDFADCAACHGDPDQVRLSKLPPYAAATGE